MCVSLCVRGGKKKAVPKLPDVEGKYLITQL